MRKWIRALAAWALVIGMIPAMPVKAEEELNLDGESAVLIDADSGAVLYEKNADDRHYPASITKIMTVYLALSQGHPDQILTATDTAIDNIDRQIQSYLAGLWRRIIVKRRLLRGDHGQCK